MTILPETRPPAQADMVSLSVHAEIHTDLDDGTLSLITETATGNWVTITPDELRAHAEQARADLARLNALATRYETLQALQALASKHQLAIVENDLAGLEPELRDKFQMLYLPEDSCVLVPTGQAPIRTLRLLMEILEKAAGQ